MVLISEYSSPFFASWATVSKQHLPRMLRILNPFGPKSLSVNTLPRHASRCWRNVAFLLMLQVYVFEIENGRLSFINSVGSSHVRRTLCCVFPNKALCCVPRSMTR